MSLVAKLETSWGTAELHELEFDVRFFPHKTMGIRLLRDGVGARCVFADGMTTYDQMCKMWVDADNAISRYIQSREICSPS